MAKGDIGYLGFGSTRAFELPDGRFARTSPVGRARLRYNDVTGQLEQSLSGAPYVPLGGGPATLPPSEVAWVDSRSGNDATAQVGRIDLPFATVQAAVDGVVARLQAGAFSVQVLIQPGNYPEDVVVRVPASLPQLFVPITITALTRNTIVRSISAEPDGSPLQSFVRLIFENLTLGDPIGSGQTVSPLRLRTAAGPSGMFVLVRFCESINQPGFAAPTVDVGSIDSGQGELSLLWLGGDISQQDEAPAIAAVGLEALEVILNNASLRQDDAGAAPSILLDTTTFARLEATLVTVDRFGAAPSPLIDILAPNSDVSLITSRFRTSQPSSNLVEALAGPSFVFSDRVLVASIGGNYTGVIALANGTLLLGQTTTNFGETVGFTGLASPPTPLLPTDSVRMPFVNPTSLQGATALDSLYDLVRGRRQINGPLSGSPVVVAPEDSTVLIFPAVGGTVVELPAISDVGPGKIFTIKDALGTAKPGQEITIQPNAADATEDGSPSYIINASFRSLTLQSQSPNIWYRI